MTFAGVGLGVGALARLNGCSWSDVVGLGMVGGIGTAVTVNRYLNGSWATKKEFDAYNGYWTTSEGLARYNRNFNTREHLNSFVRGEDLPICLVHPHRGPIADAIVIRGVMQNQPIRYEQPPRWQDFTVPNWHTVRTIPRSMSRLVQRWHSQGLPPALLFRGEWRG